MPDYLRSPLFQMKCVELLLGILSIGFIVTAVLPSVGSVFLTELAHLTLFGYFLLNLLVIIGFVIHEPISRALLILISGSATLLNAITAIILIIGWSDQQLQRLLISGIITLLNAVVNGGDTYCTLKYFTE